MDDPQSDANLTSFILKGLESAGDKIDPYNVGPVFLATVQHNLPPLVLPEYPRLAA